MADDMRRFQFWENFYLPLKRIKDRGRRAELALKILEAAFEDEPPEFDDLEGLVADSIVPLIQRDMETPKGGRGHKTGSKTSRKPARKTLRETQRKPFPKPLWKPLWKVVYRTPLKQSKAKLKLCFLKKQRLQRALLRSAPARRWPRCAQKAPREGPPRPGRGRGGSTATSNAAGAAG